MQQLRMCRRIEALAAQHGLGMNALLLRLLEAGLNHHFPEESA
jgi:hypothetical protein